MVKDFSQPTVVSDAFVSLAVDAGIVGVIKGLIGVGKPLNVIIQEVYLAILPDEPEIAQALNYDTFRAVLNYMASVGETVVLGFDLPKLLNESGPANITAVRDAVDDSIIRVRFTAPPNGYRAKIFGDGNLVMVSASLPVGGMVDEVLTGMSLNAIKVRVVYQKIDDRAHTRFSQTIKVKRVNT